MENLDCPNFNFSRFPVKRPNMEGMAKRAEKNLLPAAIQAVATVLPEETAVVLFDLTDSDDEDIVDADYEAMARIRHLFVDIGQASRMEIISCMSRV